MATFNTLQSSVFRIAAATTICLVALAAFVIYSILQVMNAAFVQSTDEIIQSDVMVLRSEYSTGGLPALTSGIVEKLRLDPQALYILVDRHGARQAGNLLSWPTKLAGGTSAGVFMYKPAGPPATLPRAAAGVLIHLDDGARVVIARDIETQRRLNTTLQSSLVIGIGLLAAIGLSAGYLLARALLARIDRISLASKAFVAGNLAGRIPLNGSNDELDRLAEQINDMLSRIEQLIGGLREVSDNIAHDLKTPLNRLRNSAEAALAAPDSASWRDGLEGTIEQADELIKTFNALLLIARLEARAVDESFEIVELTEVCRGIAELYEPAAEERHIDLVVRDHSPVLVRGNRHLLGQAVANLIDNALKYGAGSTPDTGHQARVTIAATRVGDRADITVADRGTGIASSDRVRALQRFVRLDRSRTKPGTGLGLSLVAAVARLHHGSVALEDNSPGLRVHLSLPLAPNPDSVPDSKASTSP